MALLRDVHTSAPIFEGSPTECVLLAEKLGFDEVLFDDVGVEFNPDAVIRAHHANVEGLASARDEAEGEDRDRLTEALAAASSPRLAAEASHGDAKAALGEARSLVQE